MYIHIFFHQITKDILENKTHTQTQPWDVVDQKKIAI